MLPKQLKTIVKENKDKVWSVRKNADRYSYSETYLANGREMFRLDWYSNLMRPSWQIISQ
jgi:hypothetical protein